VFKSIWLFVTEACNLRCPYCFNSDELFTRKAIITNDSYEKIIDHFLLYNEASQQGGVPEIVLFGGEPTLRPDLLDGIMAYANEKTQGEIRFNLLTNGTLLGGMKEKVLEWNEKYTIRFQLSIDGDIALKTPRVYGIDPKKYAEQIRGTLTLFKDAGIPFNLRGTLIPEHLSDYAHNIQFFLNEFKNTPFQPQIAIMPDFVHSKWTIENYEEVAVQASKIVDILATHYIETGTLVTETFVDRAIKTIEAREKSKSLKTSGTICGFSGGLCGVGTEGDIYACHRVYGEEAMHIGNLKTGIVDWQKMHAIHSVVNDWRFARPSEELPFDNCEDCDLKNNCTSICPAESFVINGEKPYVSCNPVLYWFNHLFIQPVEEKLYSLIEKNNNVCSCEKIEEPVLGVAREK